MQKYEKRNVFHIFHPHLLNCINVNGFYDYFCDVWGLKSWMPSTAIPIQMQTIASNVRINKSPTIAMSSTLMADFFLLVLSPIQIIINNFNTFMIIITDIKWIDYWLNAKTTYTTPPFQYTQYKMHRRKRFELKIRFFNSIWYKKCISIQLVRPWLVYNLVIIDPNGKHF